MVALERLSPRLQKHFLDMPCPMFDATPWVTGPPVAQRNVALVSTAGLHGRGDLPITPGSPDYRVIPAATPANDLVMSHVSTNFDRTGFQLDWNVVLPLDRLRELAQAGEIGSVASRHYSFMGAIGKLDGLEPRAAELAQEMRADGVDAALLVPV